MPHKTKSVPLAQKMPDACKDAEGITDDRAKYDACHSHKLCKNDGADDVAADLEGVADIVAQLVPIAVNHLFEIEDDDRQQGIDRSEHIVFQRLVYTVPPEPSARSVRATLPLDESHFHGS